MWTETHFYRFPDEQSVPFAEGAIDVIGQTDEGFLVNARWVESEPESWSEYRVYPQTPKRDFA